MSFRSPKTESVQAAFPELSGVTFLAAGGFKAVYDCKIEGVRQAFKLAFIPPVTNPRNEEEVAAHEEVRGRVRRELGLLAELKRPEIVKLGQVKPRDVKVEGNDFVAYSEEFLDGQNLWDILRRPGDKPSEEELKSLLGSLIYAIEEMWSHKIIHRDIKPCNIIKLKDPKRPFVLLDLGIAFVIGETALTNAGFPRTNRYMAPEMIHPNFRETLDYRSDLYTSALTVYEYGAKRHPIAADFEDPMVTISRAVRDIPAPLKDRHGDLSDDFCWVIDQLLKKRPALRPANLKMLLKRAGITP